MKFAGAQRRKRSEAEDAEKKHDEAVSLAVTGAVDALHKYAAHPLGSQINSGAQYKRAPRQRTAGLDEDSHVPIDWESEGNACSSKSVNFGDGFSDGVETIELPSSPKARAREAIEDEPLPCALFNEDLTVRMLSLYQKKKSMAGDLDNLHCFKCKEPRALTRLRMEIYYALEDPRPDQLIAQNVSFLLFGTIVFSITCMILETMPELYGKITDDSWFKAEVACTATFTTEFVLRLFTCDVTGQRRMKFLMKPMNLCDFLAILPLYIQLILASSSSGADKAAVLRVLRSIRMVRLFRIMKLARYSSSIRLMAVALFNSLRALWVLVFFLSLGIVLFSSAIYYVEKFDCPSLQEVLAAPGAMERYVLECSDGFNNGVSPSYGLCCDEFESPLDFPSIPDAFWWSIVTMTTVGYGDVYPRTTQGKIVAVFTFLSGILLIALPVAIVGKKFTDVYEAHSEARMKPQEEQTDGDMAPYSAFPTQRGAVASSDHVASRDHEYGRITRKKESVAGQAAECYSLLEVEDQAKEVSEKLKKCWVPDPKLAEAVKELADLVGDAENTHKAIHSISVTKFTWAEMIVGRMDMVISALRFGVLREQRNSLISQAGALGPG